MFNIYIIQSEVNGRYYYGFTEQEVSERVKDHNSGKSKYTSKFRPWKLIWSGHFLNEDKAKTFEKYLKTPSGHAFSRKRLI